MDWQPAEPHPKAGELPEICLNLWWFRDATSGFVYRLAGRAYALSGTDEEKLRVLRQLAPTDFHNAPNFELPKRFTIVTDHGTLEGVTDQTIVVQHHADVFNHVFNALEHDLPAQMRSLSGEPSTYKLKLSKEPLCCTTCVHEHEDGRLVPQISAKSP